MQVILAIVAGDNILVTTNREPAAGDAIAVASDQRTKTGVPVFIVARRIKTEHHIIITTVAIRRCQALDNSTERQDRHRHAILVL
jgi:hypothetical protein